MKKFQIGIILIAFCAADTLAQYISNPSFESDFIGVGAPKGWFPCNDDSTPDTQPLEWEVTQTPSHGKTYLGMCGRGTSMNLAKNEAIQTNLINPMEKDDCYRLSIDLARSEISDGLYNSYPHPMRLVFWGGQSSCNKAVKLYETDYIDHLDWQKYSFMIYPKVTFTYLILEIKVDDNARGYMLLDNIILEQPKAEDYIVMMDTTIKPDDEIFLKASESTEHTWRPQEGLSCYDCPSPQVFIENSETFICTLKDSLGCLYEEIFTLNIDVYVPNVFTPNDDGINDIFRIDGLETSSSLIIFNRKGKMVYQNKHYDNSWDGRDLNGNKLSEDAYWYVLKIPGVFNELKGYVYIKR